MDARVQRLLWASTGTKDPRYPDLMYVEPLIGAMTINTMPHKTIAAFLDHGTVENTTEQGLPGGTADHGKTRAARRAVRAGRRPARE